MVKDRVRAMCWYSFFVRATTPSMDRDWRGSRSRSPRYHTAIGRARPDPKGNPEVLTHALSPTIPLTSRGFYLARSKIADGFYSTGYSLYIG